MIMLRGALLLTFLSFLCGFVSPASAQGSGSLGLDQLVLDISPQQVVGKPWTGRARILLLDAQNNLQPNYSLSLNPIVLTTVGGSIFPSILNDPLWLDSGIVYLDSIGVRFNGSSGLHPISATSGIISSSSVLISFNGYNILGVTDFKGDSLTEVFSGHPISVKVAVTNGGTKLADSNPSLRAFFKSGGGSTRVFFPPDDSGAVDTVSIALPTTGLQPGQDTLLITLESSYRLDTTVYTVRDTVKLPQTVLPLATVSLRPGSVRPDSVYAGEDFPLALEIAAAGFEGSIDSSHLRVDLTVGPGFPSLTTIYSGPVTHTSFQNNIISYAGVPSQISLAAGLLPGWYRLRMTYSLVSGGSVFSFTGTQTDSVFILPFTVPQFVPGTFAPDIVAAGSLAEFRFDLAIVDTVTLQVNPTPGTATFTVTGTGGFLAQGNLDVPNFTLRPGRTTVRTERIFVPANQLNTDLTITAGLQYRQGGVTYLNLSTDFDGQLIHVQELPIARITRVDVIAPNAPKVNVHQPYSIIASVANVSTTAIDSLVLRLTSDGASIPDSLFDTIPQIAPGETVDVQFEIVSQDSDPDELFRADIVSEHHGQLLPVDNIALVQVQTPASIVLSAKLDSLDVVKTDIGYYVETGASFDFDVFLANLGQAPTSEGSYRLETDKVDILSLNPNWDPVGDLTVPGNIKFRLTAPSVDTSFTLQFTLTHRPVDLNSGLPAQMSNGYDTTYAYKIIVASTEATLFVEPVAMQAAPLGKDRESAIFSLSFTNTAVSGVNTVELDSLFLRARDKDNNPVPIAGILDVGSAAFYDGTTPVSTASASADSLRVIFDDYIVAAGEQVTLTFRAKTIAEIADAFALVLDTEGVFGHYVSGPADGDPIPVTAPPNGESIFRRVFTVAGATLEQSFMIQNNPWHPEAGKARFAYSLPQESAIDFRILTLGGEEVFAVHIDEGSSLTTPGPHIMEWDGRNGEGRVVLDGVYVAIMTVARTGEEARIKVAVLK